MPLATQNEIQAQERFVYKAEQDLMGAKLRLRAMKGEPLFRQGDSMGVTELSDVIDQLIHEFGSRNIRMY